MKDLDWLGLGKVPAHLNLHCYWDVYSEFVDWIFLVQKVPPSCFLFPKVPRLLLCNAFCLYRINGSC